MIENLTGFLEEIQIQGGGNSTDILKNMGKGVQPFGGSARSLRPAVQGKGKYTIK